jgi:hypothetical protein
MISCGWVFRGLLPGFLMVILSCATARSEESTGTAIRTQPTAGVVSDATTLASAATSTETTSDPEKQPIESVTFLGGIKSWDNERGAPVAPLAYYEAIPMSSQTSSAQGSGSGTSIPAPGDETSDHKWHYYATGYLWIPGIHGTVGVRGFDTSVHVSASDIFSNFRGGLLGVFTPTYNRFSAPVDYMWMRLRDSKAIPPRPEYSVRATLNFSIVTPKVNYLFLDNPKLKVYGTAGARVWHVGTTLSLVPVIVGYFPYKGVTWTDFVMGARFNVPLGSKASVDILGDGGKGGATLDYQVAGLLNYRAKSNLTLQGGWRYLTTHYGNNGNVLNITVQGILLGATYRFK